MFNPRYTLHSSPLLQMLGTKIGLEIHVFNRFSNGPMTVGCLVRKTRILGDLYGIQGRFL